MGYSPRLVWPKEKMQPSAPPTTDWSTSATVPEQTSAWGELALGRPGWGAAATSPSPPVSPGLSVPSPKAHQPLGQAQEHVQTHVKHMTHTAWWQKTWAHPHNTQGHTSLTPGCTPPITHVGTHSPQQPVHAHVHQAHLCKHHKVSVQTHNHNTRVHTPPQSCCCCCCHGHTSTQHRAPRLGHAMCSI